ncbi:hypothetical protein C922_05194 [Plasmodium inui San Antonio 1]|uniref:Uncharacterized protein n=1 Tax=Plasmodium inui San Antonio 1 TaxID=1237626 RepID=W7A5Q2_9APIC|nr:hypothetical protein C922_05194 [Plasmodium inui San Antonio 1]EUD64419.1 hypothetical protein C922_05194 [Plasmodium inui San Antonio 1]
MGGETFFSQSANFDLCDEELCVANACDGGDANQGGFMDIASLRHTLRNNDKKYFHGNIDQGILSQVVNLYDGDSDRNVEACSPHGAGVTEQNKQNDAEDKRGNGSNTERKIHHKRGLLLINIFLNPDNDTSPIASKGDDLNKILPLVKQLLMRRNTAEGSALISYGNDIRGRYYHISNNENLLDVLKNEDIRKSYEISFEYVSAGEETEKSRICSELNRNGEMVDGRGNSRLLTHERCDSFTIVEGDDFNCGRGGENSYLILRQSKPALLGLIGEKQHRDGSTQQVKNRQTIDSEEESRKYDDESENAWHFLKSPADREETYGGIIRNGNGHSGYAFDVDVQQEMDTPHDANFLFKGKHRGNDGKAFSYFQMGEPERGEQTQRGGDGQGKTERGEEVEELEEVNRADKTKQTEGIVQMDGSNESNELEKIWQANKAGKMYQTYHMDSVCQEQQDRKRIMPQNQTSCVEKANENVPNRLKMNEGFMHMEGTLYQKENTSDKPNRRRNDVEIFREGKDTDARIKTSSEVPCAKELRTTARKTGRKKGTQLRREHRKDAPTEKGGITKGLERAGDDGNLGSSEKVWNQEHVVTEARGQNEERGKNEESVDKAKIEKMEETIPNVENEKVRQKPINGDCTACAIFYKIKKGCIYTDASNLSHSEEQQNAPRRASKKGKRKTTRVDRPSIVDKCNREGPSVGSASNWINMCSDGSSNCTSRNIINRALTNRLKWDDNEELISYILDTIKREESANNLKIRKDGDDENGSGANAQMKSGNDGKARQGCSNNRGDASRSESVTKKEKQETHKENTSNVSLGNVCTTNEEEMSTHNGYALFPHQTYGNGPKYYSVEVPFSHDAEEKHGMKKGVTGNTFEGNHPEGNMNNHEMCNWLRVVQKMGKGVHGGCSKPYGRINLPLYVQAEEEKQQRRDEHFMDTHRTTTISMKNKMRNISCLNTHDEGVQTEGDAYVRGNSDLFKKGGLHYIGVEKSAYGQLGKFFLERKKETEVDPNITRVENIHTDRCTFHVNEHFNQGMFPHLNSTNDPKIRNEDGRGLNMYEKIMGNSSHKGINRVTSNDGVMEVIPSVGNVQTETKAEMKFLHSRGKGRNLLPNLQQNSNYLHFNAWRNRMVYFKDLCDNPSCHYNLGDLHDRKENVVSNIYANYTKGIYPSAQTFGNLNKIHMSAAVGELLKRESYTYDEIFNAGNRTNYGVMHTPNVNAKQLDTVGADQQNNIRCCNSRFNTKGTLRGGMHECRRDLHRGGSQQRGIYQRSAHYRKGNHSNDHTMHYHPAIDPAARTNENYDNLVTNPFLQSGDSPKMCFRRKRKEFNFRKKSSLHRIAEFKHPAKDPHYRMLKRSMDNYKNGSLITGSKNGYFQVRRFHGSDGVAEQHIGEKYNNPMVLLSFVKSCKVCERHHVRSAIRGKCSEDIGSNLIGNFRRGAQGDFHRKTHTGMCNSYHEGNVTNVDRPYQAHKKSMLSGRHSCSPVHTIEKSIEVDPANVKEPLEIPSHVFV